jgi:hypothetical protein
MDIWTGEAKILRIAWGIIYDKGALNAAFLDFICSPAS